ncbi:toll/interleukin-1 receptor domain-containing protein [Kordia sp.]|uniref:toll/interleukin-1 receptor domain-containing protein n=1 Tax=Kordia sp. TaxID=1965332 RepID=UPI003D2C3794
MKSLTEYLKEELEKGNMRSLSDSIKQSLIDKEKINWVREYNKLLVTINKKESYFSGGTFISIIREFDPYFHDYLQYINFRKNEGLSTSRKDYFYDILMSFKEDVRLDIINRMSEHANELEENYKEPTLPDFGFETPTIVEPILAEKKEKILVTEESEETINTETIENPTVFISYSWDNEEHQNWILNLSKRLFDSGVQVILDRYELKPGDNMMTFMEQSIPKADKVLIIFTPNYKTKAEGRKGGVGFEYSILNTELYGQISENSKYIPVLKSGTFQESIPNFIQQFIAVDMTNDSLFESKLNDLLLTIYNKPLVEKPKLGKSPFK